MININRTASQSSTSQGEVLADELLTGSEARDLLFALLDATVNFNKLQNLRSEVRTHNPNQAAARRCDELEALRSDLRERLVEADRQGLRVRVRSTFELEVEDGFGADAASRLS